MNDAHFRPLNSPATAAVAVERIAPTERETPQGRMLRGIVHDPRLARWEASLATPDCSRPPTIWRSFAQTLLNGGVGPNGRRVLSPLAVRAMIDAASTPSGPAPGAGLGRADQLQLAARRALR